VRFPKEIRFPNDTAGQAQIIDRQVQFRVRGIQKEHLHFGSKRLGHDTAGKMVDKADVWLREQSGRSEKTEGIDVDVAVQNPNDVVLGLGIGGKQIVYFRIDSHVCGTWKAESRAQSEIRRENIKFPTDYETCINLWVLVHQRLDESDGRVVGLCNREDELEFVVLLGKRRLEIRKNVAVESFERADNSHGGERGVGSWFGLRAEVALVS
jgi:hypothetical protein